MTNDQTVNADPAVITLDTLLEHWQGHRRLTRRMIEVFPEDKLFTYSIGGMRPFSELVMEFLGMAVPGMKGIATGVWNFRPELPHHQKKEIPATKQELLKRWDEATDSSTNYGHKPRMSGSWKQIRLLASGKGRFTLFCFIGLIMKYIIGDRPMCISVHWELSHLLSGIVVKNPLKEILKIFFHVPNDRCHRAVSEQHLLCIINQKNYSMLNKELSTAIEPETVITQDELLKHWQGHRGLTRRMIEVSRRQIVYLFYRRHAAICRPGV